MSWRVTHLSIKGVKGVLDRAGEFDLADGKSIAIYAPNGCGKSGYADAVEYLFSRDGSVEHLGKGGQDSESGGKHALTHVLAAEMGIIPEVTATLRHTQSKQTFQASRVVKTGRSDPLPSSLEPLLDAAPAYRVLRQHDLRRFVVDMAPREKYTELSRWIGLEQLELVLKHLTTTAQTLAKTNHDREIEERNQDIVRHTEGTVTAYDPLAVYLWCARRAKRHLETVVAITSTADIKRTIGLLREQRNGLVLAAGKASERYTAKTKIEALTADAVSEGGRIAVCRARLNMAVRAETQLHDARSAAKDSVFQELWAAASKVLDAQTLEVCPLCQTSWEATKSGSQQDARVYLSTSLGGLTALRDAQGKYKESVEQFNAAMVSLVAALQDAEAQFAILGLPDLADATRDLVIKTQGLSLAKRSASEVEGPYLAVLSEVQQFLSSSVLPAVTSVRVEDIPTPAQEIEETIAHFQGIESALGRLAELQRESQEYRKIEQGFSAVDGAMKQRVSELIDSVVEALRQDVTRIYRAIHPTGAVPDVHIVPDTEAKSLSIRVEFHSKDRIVPPGGYLSEAQVNTLGIALFFSSVRRFNREFPFVFLDDIVSSYDADHRARIVDVIAEELQGFQVFLTTHDERFHAMLKSRLSSKGWLFERITFWDIARGPKRETDVLKPDQINKILQDGNPQIAGNGVRQYMEEWLDSMCAAYDAYTVHRRGLREYERTLFDFWGPFVTRLQKMKGGYFRQRIEGQPCYQRLSGHSLLNYYSHWQASPYGWSCIGDVKYVWEEFQQFEKLFNCYSCGKLLKYSGGDKRLYCTCGGQAFPPASDGLA